MTTANTAEVYLATGSSKNSEVTPLQSRTFGTWSFLSSIIRIYAAYRINDPLIYELALCSYGLAWAHFHSEWLIFGTARWGRGLAGPIIVSNGSLIWMLVQWTSYVG